MPAIFLESCARGGNCSRITLDGPEFLGHHSTITAPRGAQEVIMRKFKWRRQIGQPVFPAAEYADGFPVRGCVSYDGDEDVQIFRARARWLVTLMCDGRPISTRWVGNTRTASAWAVWYKLATSVDFAHVYDRKTRTSSRARVDWARSTMKACISVGADDNGAATVLQHYHMDGY